MNINLRIPLKISRVSLCQLHNHRFISLGREVSGMVTSSSKCGRLKLELIPRSVYPLPSQSRRTPWPLAGSGVVVTMRGGRDTMTLTYVFIKHYSSFFVCSFCVFVIGSHCSLITSRIKMSVL